MIKCLFIGFFPTLFFTYENTKTEKKLLFATLISGVCAYCFASYASLIILIYAVVLYWWMAQKEKGTIFFLLLSIGLLCFYHAVVSWLQPYSWIECVLLCMTYVLAKMYIPKLSFSFSTLEWICADLILWSSIVFYLLMRVHTRMSACLLLVYAIKDGLLCFLFYRMVKRLMDDQQLKQRCKSWQEQEKLYADLKEANKINQSFRHDQANLMNVMYALLASDKERAKVFFDECMKKTSVCCAVLSGNVTLDWLLSSKQNKINQQGNIMQVYVNSALDGINDRALVVILSNLLDNAIEAQAHVLDKSIVVRISQDEHHYYIKVENRYCKELVCRKNQTYQSLKKDLQHHGIGLQNVRTCVEELKGTLRIKTNDSTFDVFVCIPRSK